MEVNISTVKLEMVLDVIALSAIIDTMSCSSDAWK